MAAGFAPGMADATLAGIACVHDLVIVTNNTKHFQPFGVAVMTPADVVRKA
jgi:predicted nucleic acid-binding protein